MAVNLISAFGKERAAKVLERSFAQFQADRSVVGLAQVITDKENSLHGYEKSMACHLGDFREYSNLRREISDLERESSRIKNRSGADTRLTKQARNVESQLGRLRKELRAILVISALTVRITLDGESAITDCEKRLINLLPTLNQEPARSPKFSKESSNF